MYEDVADVQFAFGSFLWFNNFSEYSEMYLLKKW